MNSTPKSALSEFSRRAIQRLQAKKIPKKQILHIPSLEADITIRSLSYEEIVECTNIDDSADKNRSDKYCMYLSVVSPDLKQAAKEIMESESGLPADQRSLLEPLDIVDLFDMGEVTEIAMKVMELSGVLNNRKVTVVEQLKN